MLTDFVLGTEIAKEGNFHIANISMVIKNPELVEGTDYLKFGGITLLSKKSLGFPRNILLPIHSGKMTDLSNLIPLGYFKDELENNLNMLKKTLNKLKFLENNL